MHVETRVKEYLHRLGLDIHAPTLEFLNQIVDAHQRKIIWENITKMADTERGQESDDFLPSIQTYMHRLVHLGAGGTCWTLSRGLHWLLRELGFDAHYLYMDSGHLCVRVDLDQPYYVDVGFCAPLFRAYPMRNSFTIQDTRMIFEYRVDGEKIKVIQTPGPTKVLNPTPVSISSLAPVITQSNDWRTSVVLKVPRLFGYIDGVPTSITGRTLSQHFPSGVYRVDLTDDEMNTWVTRRFGMSDELFRQAMEIYHWHVAEGF